MKNKNILIVRIFLFEFIENKYILNDINLKNKKIYLSKF